jgi:hypothetical protein
MSLIEFKEGILVATLRLLFAALALACSTGAQAVPIFADARVNEQVSQIAIAGIHFGDTQEQVEAALRHDGWTLTTSMRTAESFRDQVGYEVSKRRGLKYVTKDPSLPEIAEYRKGPQSLSINYCAHSRGNLACTIRYNHANAEDEALREAYFKRIDEKFSATPLVHVKFTLYCLPLDARCLKNADPENGGVLSDYPSVFLNGSMVVLHGGEQATKAFSKDFQDAVTKASGGLEDVSL